MKVELAVALIAGGVALASAAGTIWSSVWNAKHSDANARAIEELKGANEKAIEQLKIDNERLKAAAERQKEMSNFSEPLARSAYDLQSRLYNILKQNLIEIYLTRGNDREKSYVINNTAFLIGQYLCWTELVRREIQFIDLGQSDKTRKLLRLQDTIYSLWGTDEQPPDVASLENGLSQATERLRNVQHALIDLLNMLDPDYVRFPEDRRSKT